MQTVASGKAVNEYRVAPSLKFGDLTIRELNSTHGTQERTPRAGRAGRKRSRGAAGARTEVLAATLTHDRAEAHSADTQSYTLDYQSWANRWAVIRKMHAPRESSRLASDVYVCTPGTCCETCDLRENEIAVTPYMQRGARDVRTRAPTTQNALWQRHPI